MEDFLLLFDELDDLIAMVGALWRPVAGFLLAVLLFVATGFVFYSMPMLAEAIAFVLVSLGVIDTFRERKQSAAAVRESNV
jgi:hypothetical protein